MAVEVEVGSVRMLQGQPHLGLVIGSFEGKLAATAAVVGRVAACSDRGSSDKGINPESRQLSDDCS
eukprot:gene9892-10049_t